MKKINKHVKINNVKFLRAKMKDAKELAKLELFCFDVKSIKIEMMALISWQIMIGKQVVYKAMVGDKIIGGSVSTPTARRTWYMDSLFVHPDYRHLGVGRKLREYNIKKAWLRPIETMVNIKRPHLIPFYESFGFKIKKKVHNYFENGETHYIMMLE